MALSAGSVTIDGSGGHSGSGMALSLYEAQLTTMTAFLNAINAAQRITAKQGMAAFCNALATGIVPYLTANAAISVTVGTGVSGLQRMSNPLAVDVDTQGPSTSKVLSGTLA